MPAPNGQGTVVANGNFFAGLRIFEAPGAAAMSTSTVSSPGRTPRTACGSTAAPVKVRNSVLLMNVLNGVYLTVYDGTAAGNDLSQIDLGTAADPGRNVLQGAVGSIPDLAGLCVSMSAGRGRLTLSARGNVFAGPTDCTSRWRHRALGGVRRVRRPRRRPGGGHHRQRRRRDLPVDRTCQCSSRTLALRARAAGQGSAPAGIQARMRAIAAFGIHLRGGM